MKKAKQLLSAALALSMVATAVSCVPKAPSSTAPSGSGAGSTPATSAISFPLEKTINVKMAGYRPDDYTMHAETEVMKQAESDTNIKIDWIDWPAGVIKEKLGVAFASGTLPDAFYGTYMFDNGQMMKYGTEGYFLDFLPYIEGGKMPNLSAAIAKEPDILKHITFPDGKVYLLPTIDETEPVPLSNDTVLINKTWLDKLKLQMPTTTDELYTVLKAFKAAGDINGNGKNDEIPLTFRYKDNNAGQRSMFGWFGLAQNTNEYPTVVGDKVVWAASQPEYKEACQYFNKLYTEGLLDPEAFTMDGPTYNAKTMTETPYVGVIAQWSEYQVNNSIKNGDEYVYLPPLTSPNGKTPQWQMRGHQQAYNGRMTYAINAKSQYVDELVAWADRWFDVERSIDTYLGGEKFVSKASDGVYSRIAKADDPTKFPTWGEKSGHSAANFSLAIILKQDFKWDTLSDAAANKIKANDVYGKFMPETTYPVWTFYTAEENEVVTKLTVDLFEYLHQSTADFVTKGVDDAKWATYTGKLDTLGLQDLLKVWQAVLDRS